MPRSFGTTNANPYASAPTVGQPGDTYYNTTSKVLYVSDGSVWIAMGGVIPSEVEINVSDPIGTNPSVELWYDSDAPNVNVGGVGLPSAGTTGQVLYKKSSTDYDVGWTNPGAAIPTYATKTALDAWAAPDASQAYTSDYGFLWLRRNGAWVDPYPRGWVASSSSWDGPTSGTTQLNISAIASVRLFAGRRYAVRFSNAAMYGSTAGDSFVVGYRIDGGALQGLSVSTHVANIYFDAPMYFFPFTTTDGLHSFDACAYRTTGTGTLQFRGRMDIVDEGPV